MPDRPDIKPAMMPTQTDQTQSAGRFADFDLARVPSPCFVIDKAVLEHNLRILKDLRTASGVRILAALKAFSFWHLAPLISEYVDGVCASGLWEARLGRTHYGGLVETYAPAFKASEFDDIAALSDHIIFNTPHQLARFAEQARTHHAALGLRLNPQHTEAHMAKYDACADGSRLGWPVSHLTAAHIGDMSGLHIHNLCEQGFAPLARTWDALAQALENQIGGLAHLSAHHQLEWLNLGGGHLLTAPHYDRAALIAFLQDIHQRTGLQIYLEPGAAIAFDAGILVGEVLDVMDNDGLNAILDISATCHMPDVLEAPYRPALLNEYENKNKDSVAVRLGGASCLAGDVMGVYHFARPPQIGDRLAFLDQAHYSMVKMTSFNGVRLPALAVWDSRTDALNVIKEFTYADFETRLS